MWHFILQDKEFAREQVRPDLHRREVYHYLPYWVKSEVGTTLKQFCEDVGIPARLTFDGAKETTGASTEFMRVIRQNHIDWKVIEPYSHWQNRAEDAIRELRRRWKSLRQKRQVPKQLCDYGLIHLARLASLTVRGTDNCTPWEIVTGETYQNMSTLLSTIGFGTLMHQQRKKKAPNWVDGLAFHIG